MALLPGLKRCPTEKQNKKLDSRTSLYLPICLSFSNEVPCGSWNYFFFFFFLPCENGKSVTSYTKLKPEYLRFSWKSCLWLGKIRICYDGGFGKHFFHGWVKDRNRSLNVWKIPRLLSEEQQKVLSRSLSCSELPVIPLFLLFFLVPYFPHSSWPLRKCH